jgi:endonuclease VIII
MPEGDALARAARRLQVLVGQHLEVDAPNPRARVKRIAERLDGKRLESVAAQGKNVFLTFEQGLVLRSHLKMKGRWWVHERGRRRGEGLPWLVLRGATHEAVLWHGPVLELDDAARWRLGPDILASPPDFAAMLVNLRALPAATLMGEALQVQRAVAGIGNLWTAEALWEARLSPWRRLGDVSDDELLRALHEAARMMRGSLDEGRTGKRVHRRSGRPCLRCGTAIRSWPLGESARTAYWCPECQHGGVEPPAK